YSSSLSLCPKCFIPLISTATAATIADLPTITRKDSQIICIEDISPSSGLLACTYAFIGCAHAK
ncbi:unnamed protein product, partial [Musa acuminata subsp. burmannicoides]